MEIKVYLIITLVLLCIAIINNVLMYYKCYLNNELSDPLLPENIGIYRINIYYNKFKDPIHGIGDEIKQSLVQFKDKTFGKYVIAYNKPTKLEYEQISKLGNYKN